MTIIEQLAALVDAAHEITMFAEPGSPEFAKRLEQLGTAFVLIPPDWEQQLRAVEREAVLEGERRIDAAESRVEVLTGALEKLTNEADGLRAFEWEIREATGHTNWNVLRLRVDEARAALAPKAEA